MHDAFAVYESQKVYEAPHHLGGLLFIDLLGRVKLSGQEDERFAKDWSDVQITSFGQPISCRLVVLTVRQAG